MTTKDDGGPAFPRAPFEYVDPIKGTDWAVREQRGMSLRQWYAGCALMGLAARLSADDVYAHDRGALEARAALALADATIAEGKK